MQKIEHEHKAFLGVNGIDLRALLNDTSLRNSCENQTELCSKNKCRLLDRSHSDWCEMVPHSGFDLHFSDNE